jgi:ABC-type multidrug transport system ATPase subunit
MLAGGITVVLATVNFPNGGHGFLGYNGGLLHIPPIRRPSLAASEMVVLAQALISEPRYLLIDELSLGLAPVVVSRLIPVIAAVAESGTGVLLIEQFATVALGLAQQAHIMEGGRIRFSGLARELREQPELLSSAYLLRGSPTAGNTQPGSSPLESGP